MPVFPPAPLAVRLPPDSPLEPSAPARLRKWRWSPFLLLGSVGLAVVGGLVLVHQGSAEPRSDLDGGPSTSASIVPPSSPADPTSASTKPPSAGSSPPASPPPSAKPPPEPPSAGSSPPASPLPSAKPPPEPSAPDTPSQDAWIRYAQRVAMEMSRSAAKKTHATTPISDEFERLVGFTRYPAEHETKRSLRLSAIVDPNGARPFAVIEHEATGLAMSYREGAMLKPGVLPGIWVVDVEPGVVHLLDLEDRAFEYLTFSKPRRKSTRSRSRGRTGTQRPRNTRRRR